VSYAPSAPQQIWALKGLSDGAKLSYMHWWGKADHDKQQDPQPCTVWVAAQLHPDGSKMAPTESLIAELRERVHPDKADRTLRGHIKEIEDAGLASFDGRCIDLVPPHLAVPTRRNSAGTRRKSAGEILPDTGQTSPDTGQTSPEPGENPPSHSYPPVPPNFSPTPPTGQVTLPGVPVASEARTGIRKVNEVATPAQIREWWAKVYLPLRKRVFDRWHPANGVKSLDCTDDRLKDIRARLSGSCGSKTPEEQLEALTHVIERVEERINSQRGAKVPTRTGGTYNTMDNIGPAFWLRRENFNGLLETPAPPRSATTTAAVGDFERIEAPVYDPNGPVRRRGA
jgi:hypothetical protein